MIDKVPIKSYNAILHNMRAQHTGLEHLNWIYDRMRHVHNENPNVDYMITFRQILDELEWGECPVDYLVY